MIKCRTRTFSVIAGVVFIVLAAATYVLFSAYDEIVAGLCGTTIRRVVSAPSGKATAVIFERDCGATTSFSTQISIVPDGAAFSPERYPAFFSVGGNHDILLR